MSIILNGMKMPKTCNDCPFVCNPSYFAYAWCELLNQHCNMEESKRKVAAFCPLIALPDKHGRLVDLDAMVENYWDGHTMEIGEEALKRIPVIVEEERRAT